MNKELRVRQFNYMIDLTNYVNKHGIIQSNIQSINVVAINNNMFVYFLYYWF